MDNENKKELTPEEEIRKARISKRLFILLIILDVLLVGYLVFEMITIITKSRSNNQQQAASNFEALIWHIKNISNLIGPKTY